MIARRHVTVSRCVMAAGLLVCTAWYFTILAGFFTLYCPVMYLMFFYHKVYRQAVDILFALWELYPVALFQCCFNTKIHHFGDYVDPNENTIIIMNHRTRVDWNYVWMALYHASQSASDTETCICKEKAVVKSDDKSNFFDALIGGKSRTKFVLKDEIKNIPGMGWIMQLNFFLYVKRSWSSDQLSLAQFVEYYSRLQQPYRLVLFPEGTDLSEDNRFRSEKYALANNLPHYAYVLHPRTTGFSALCASLRGAGLVSVYDVTVAYDAPAQTEAELLRGKMPKHVYFHFKRYSINEIPAEEDALRTWLNARWRDKERSLHKFHNDGSFIDSITNRAPLKRIPRSLSVATIGLLFWTLIDVVFLYSLLNSVTMQFWVIYHTILFVFVTWYFGGFHNIQYRLMESLKF